MATGDRGREALGLPMPYTSCWAFLRPILTSPAPPSESATQEKTHTVDKMACLPVLLLVLCIADSTRGRAITSEEFQTKGRFQTVLVLHRTLCSRWVCVKYRAKGSLRGGGLLQKAMMAIDLLPSYATVMQLIFPHNKTEQCVIILSEVWPGATRGHITVGHSPVKVSQILAKRACE